MRRGVPGCMAGRAVCGRVISVVRVPVEGSAAETVVVVMLVAPGSGAEMERPKASSEGRCSGLDVLAAGGADCLSREEAATPAAALRAEEEASEAALEKLEPEAEELVDRAEEMVGRRRCFSSRSADDGQAGEG